LCDSTPQYQLASRSRKNVAFFIPSLSSSQNGAAQFRYANRYKLFTYHCALYDRAMPMDDMASLPRPATFAHPYIPHYQSGLQLPMNTMLSNNADAPNARGQQYNLSSANSANTTRTGSPAGATPVRRPHRRIFRATTEEILRSQVRKHEGYQALSRFMASEDDFFVFRRFESINAEVILWLQDQITRLESELELMNEAVDDKCNNGSFRWNEENFPERTALLRKLYECTLEYSMQQSLVSLGKVLISKQINT
jgi:hypothetical protein